MHMQGRRHEGICQNNRNEAQLAEKKKVHPSAYQRVGGPYVVAR
jgi:hypothetical protein